MSEIFFSATFLFSTALAAAPVIVPGDTREIDAPSGGLSIVWTEPDAHDMYQLSLRGTAGQLNPVIKIERNVEVEWSADSKAFAVADNFASDTSRLLMFAVADSGKAHPLTVNMSAKLEKAFASHDHHYIKLLSWRLNVLRVRAWGYGPGEFRKDVSCVQSPANTVECH